MARNFIAIFIIINRTIGCFHNICKYLNDLIFSVSILLGISSFCSIKKDEK